MSSRRTTARRTRRGYRSSIENLQTEVSAVELETEILQLRENNQVDRQRRTQGENESAISATDILIQALTTRRGEETAIREERESTQEFINYEGARPRQRQTQDTSTSNNGNRQQLTERDASHDEELGEVNTPIVGTEEVKEVTGIQINNQNEELRRTQTTSALHGAGKM